MLENTPPSTCARQFSMPDAERDTQVWEQGFWRDIPGCQVTNAWSPMGSQQPAQGEYEVPPISVLKSQTSPFLSLADFQRIVPFKSAVGLRVG